MAQNADQSGSDAGELGQRAYCKVSEALKLVPYSFDGDKSKLKEFIDNVDTAFEIADPADHDVLLKFVIAKITGDARSKLMIKTLRESWASVKGVLEDNYAVRRTIDFYALRMFSARQSASENIMAWASRVDNLQTQFKEAAARACEPTNLEGALSLIFMMGRACFTQGLYNERIQTVVRSRDSNMNFAQCIECALEEESALLSIREKNVGQNRSNHYNRERNVGQEGSKHHSGSSSNGMRCFNCGKLGHVAARCYKKQAVVLPAPVRTMVARDETGGHGGWAGKDIECFYCKKKGHMSRNCFKRKRDMESNGGQPLSSGKDQRRNLNG